MCVGFVEFKRFLRHEILANIVGWTDVDILTVWVTVMHVCMFACVYVWKYSQIWLLAQLNDEGKGQRLLTTTVLCCTPCPGTSTEVYYYGTQLTVILLGSIPGMALICKVTLPVFYQLGIVSLNEVSWEREREMEIIHETLLLLTYMKQW